MLCTVFICLIAVSASGGAFAYFSHGSDSLLLSIAVPDATALPAERGPLFAPFNPTPDPVVPDPPNVVEDPNWLIATSGFCSSLNVVTNERDIKGNKTAGDRDGHFVAEISFSYYPQTAIKFTDFPHHLASTIEGDKDEADALVSSDWDHKTIALLEPTSTCSANEQNDLSWGISVFKVEEHRHCTDSETAWEGHPCVHYSGYVSAETSNFVNVNEARFSCQLFVDSAMGGTGVVYEGPTGDDPGRRPGDAEAGCTDMAAAAWCARKAKPNKCASRGNIATQCAKTCDLCGDGSGGDDPGRRPSKVPIFIFQGFEKGLVDETSPRRVALLAKLHFVFAWSITVQASNLKIIEIKEKESQSLLESIVTESGAIPKDYADHVTVVSSPAEAAAQCELCRALIVGNDLSDLLYTIYELDQPGRATDVGIVSQLCSSSPRSEALPRAQLISHVEERLDVTVHYTASKGIGWLLPGGPKLPERVASMSKGLTLSVKSEDNTGLTVNQQHLVSLVHGSNVMAVALTKIEKGFSHGLTKFLATPTLFAQGIETTGATTFIKMGEEEEIAMELEMTDLMSSLLGMHSPQVLAYAEIGDAACMMTSIVNLGTGKPVSLADRLLEMLAAAGNSKMLFAFSRTPCFRHST